MVEDRLCERTVCDRAVCEKVVCGKERLCVTMLHVKESCVEGSVCVCVQLCTTEFHTI